MKLFCKTKLSFLALLLPILGVAQWDTLATIPERLSFPVVAELDGRIHILGGGGTSGASSAHYAYDPSTDQWEALADIPYAAQQPAGAAASGKIHFFGGGIPNSGSPVDDHYIYDPESDTWSEGGKLTAPRAIHSAVSINGQVHSLGGQGMSTLHQVYDVDSEQWQTRASLPDAQFWYGAHVTYNDDIFRFCGGGYTSPVDNASRYFQSINSWGNLPDFPAATHAMSGAVIGDKIYLLGGYNNFIQRDEMYVYDIATQEYSLTDSPLPLGRNYHRVVAVDSCIYSLGGNHDIDETLSTQLLRHCPTNLTATKDIKIERLSNIYCNEGQLSIQLDAPLTEEGVLTVFDSSGKLLFSETFNTNTKVFEARLAVSSGNIYFARLQTDSRVLVSQFLAQ